MIRLALVDDEPLARQYVRRLLEAASDVDIVGEADDVDDAVTMLERTKPDVVLLDVQLRRASGFDILERLHFKPLPMVVFVTAYDEYAVRAFEVRAVDYLLKPFDGARLIEALDRVRDTRDNRRLSTAAIAELVESFRSRHERRYAERLLITEEGITRFVQTAEIEWIDASHNHVIVHAGGRAYRMHDSLTALEQRLDPSRFARVHRSTIINVDFVSEMQPWFSGDSILIMRRGQRLRVGRSYRSVWQRWTLRR